MRTRLSGNLQFRRWSKVIRERVYTFSVYSSRRGKTPARALVARKLNQNEGRTMIKRTKIWCLLHGQMMGEDVTRPNPDWVEISSNDKYRVQLLLSQTRSLPRILARPLRVERFPDLWPVLCYHQYPFINTVCAVHINRLRNNKCVLVRDECFCVCLHASCSITIYMYTGFSPSSYPALPFLPSPHLPAPSRHSAFPPVSSLLHYVWTVPRCRAYILDTSYAHQGIESVLSDIIRTH